MRQSSIPVVPFTAAELNMPDAPDSDYYSTGAYIREYLRSTGDSRWKLPESEFEREFFLKSKITPMNCDANCFGSFAGPVPQWNRSERVLDPLQSLNPFGAFAADANNPVATSNQYSTAAGPYASPGATKGNSILDALSGAITNITNAAAIRITPSNSRVGALPAKQDNTMLLVVGGVALLGLVLLSTRK